MPTVNVDNGSQSLFEPGFGSVLVINADTASPIWIGPQPAVHSTDTELGPGASVTLDGTVRYYGSTLTAGVYTNALVFPGGIAYSPGNSLITSVSGSINGVDSTSTLEIFQFPQAGRIWAAEVLYAIASKSGLTGISTGSAYATTGSGLILASGLAAVGGPSQANNSNSSLPLSNSLPVAAGETVSLVISAAATGGTNISQTAVATIWYSIPLIPLGSAPFAVLHSASALPPYLHPRNKDIGGKYSPHHDHRQYISHQAAISPCA